MQIIRIYGLRFKIEHAFKQAARQIGSFAYHFWMKDMIPLLTEMGISIFIANRLTTGTESNAKFTPIMSSFRLASSPRACNNISRSFFPNWFGAPSDHGLEPFVQASRHQSL